MYVEQFRKKCADREDEREKRNRSSCIERLTPRGQVRGVWEFFVPFLQLFWKSEITSLKVFIQKGQKRERKHLD